MDGGAWLATVHRVAKSWTRLSDLHFHGLEKEMATLQCSCLENPRNRGAWWAAVCGVAQSWTDLSDLAAAAAVGLLLPASSVYGILQVRILEWVAMPSSRGSS